jgi:hypothetical protein
MNVEQLQIGDRVYLGHRGAESKAFVGARGILEDDNACYASDQNTQWRANPFKDPYHDESLFEICVRTRISAATDLNEFEVSIRHSTRQLDAKEREYQKSMLSIYKRVDQKERDMNTKLMDDGKGKPVLFGEVVQLKHVRSGKFLTYSDVLVSRSEPENFATCIDGRPSNRTWFTIEPARAYQSPHGPVLLTSGVCSVFFKVTSTEDDYLHIATIPSHHPNVLLRDAFGHERVARELNCSHQKTEMEVSLFSHYQEDQATNICVGDIIDIHNPETKRYLVGDLHDIWRPETKSRFRQLRDSSEAVGFEPFEENESGSTSDGEVLHSSAYFVVARAAPEEHQLDLPGGAVRWEEKLLFRHLNTGKFLSVQTMGKNESVETDSPVDCDVMLVLKDTCDNAEFCLTRT